MSTSQIINMLQKLLSLHQSLLTLSKEKTEALKNGGMEELQAILVKERKHVQAIGKLEQEREILVTEWFKQAGITESEATVTVMLDVLQEPNEKQQLQEIFDKFVMVLMDLKKQEQLNHQLTHQSLQFVELSLDMIQPSMKNMNYGKPNTDSVDTAQKRSVFDSKA